MLSFDYLKMFFPTCWEMIIALQRLTSQEEMLTVDLLYRRRTLSLRRGLVEVVHRGGHLQIRDKLSG